MNICGVLVHALPARVSNVVDALVAMDGVEVHQTADRGRIVLTIEDTADSTAIDMIREINRLDGIVATSLVYHHFDPRLDAAEATL
jgi:nitrate reductase NapD